MDSEAGPSALSDADDGASEVSEEHSVRSGHLSSSGLSSDEEEGVGHESCDGSARGDDHADDGQSISGDSDASDGGPCSSDDKEGPDCPVCGRAL